MNPRQQIRRGAYQLAPASGTEEPLSGVGGGGVFNPLCCGATLFYIGSRLLLSKQARVQHFPSTSIQVPLKETTVAIPLVDPFSLW